MASGYARYNGLAGGDSSGGGGVTSLNGETGAVTIVAGSGITVTPSGSDITIAATGGSGANTALSNLISPTSINQSLIFGSGVAGDINTFSPAINVNSQALGVTTGAATGTGNSGALLFQTGNAASGNSGDFTFTTGTASGIRGQLQFQDGSEGTAGQVWTSTDTLGSGHWAAASGATSIGAFGSTPNPDGLSLSSNVLNLQPADSTNPGAVSITTQEFAGDKTFSGNLQVLKHEAIGATASIDPLNVLNISENFTDPTQSYGGIRTLMTVMGSGDGSGISYIGGFLGVQVDPACTMNVGSLFGSYCAVDHNGSGHIGYIVALNADPEISAGSCDYLLGVYVDEMIVGAGCVVGNAIQFFAEQLINAGTITNAYGFYIPSPANSGTITNNWGMYISDQSGVTTLAANDYNIYSAGATSKNKLEGSLILGGHLQSIQATPPTTTINANAGTGASSSVSNATDVAGHLTLTLGSIGTLSSGVQTTVNFHVAYGVAPIVVITPTNSTAALNLAAFGVYVTSTTSGFSINFATAGVATDVLTFNYHVIQTQ